MDDYLTKHRIEVSQVHDLSFPWQIGTVPEVGLVCQLTDLLPHSRPVILNLLEKLYGSRDTGNWKDQSNVFRTHKSKHSAYKSLLKNKNKSEDRLAELNAFMSESYPSPIILRPQEVSDRSIEEVILAQGPSNETESSASDAPPSDLPSNLQQVQFLTSERSRRSADSAGVSENSPGRPSPVIYQKIFGSPLSAVKALAKRKSGSPTKRYVSNLAANALKTAIKYEQKSVSQAVQLSRAKSAAVYHRKKRALDLQKYQDQVRALREGQRRKIAARQIQLHKSIEKTVSKKHEGRLTDAQFKLSAVKGKLESKIRKLETELARYKSWSQELELRVKALEEEQFLQQVSNQVHAKEGGTVTNNCRETIISLLDQGIPYGRVNDVMKLVLRFAGMELVDSVSPRTVSRISDERLALSQVHLAVALPSKSSTTLSHDETRKFGDTYQTFNLHDKEGNSYVLGLREMADKSARTTLDCFKEVMDDISASLPEDPCQQDPPGTQILGNIHSLMSDRAASCKKFADLLQDFLNQVMPVARQGWSDMNPTQQEQVSHLTMFFCGLHTLVNVADGLSSTLALLEDAEGFGESGSRRFRPSEPGIYRLVRAVSKALSRLGDEQSGVYMQFKLHMDASNSSSSLRFANFKGNRFNIIFYNSEVLVCQYKTIMEFLESLSNLNYLLQSIKTDLQVSMFLAEAKVLALFGRLVTGPLWRLLESKIHILDMSSKYVQLLKWLHDAAEDPSNFLSASSAPFNLESVRYDSDLDRIVSFKEGSAHERIVACMVLKSAHSILSRLLSDHLAGGKLEGLESSAEAREKSRSTPLHNKQCERVFGFLDQLMRRRPNASILANESLVLFSYNKTWEWFSKQTEEERSKLLLLARKLAPDIRSKFGLRKKEILDRKCETLEAQRLDRQRKEQKRLGKALKLSQQVTGLGLWQSGEDIGEGLRRLPTESEKVEALRAQISFRKEVLRQSAPAGDRRVFIFSEKGKKFASEALIKNLTSLIEEPFRQGAVLTDPALSDDTIPALVGKRVEHTFIEDGEEVCYKGRVINVVPGFPTWYNIVYEGSHVHIYSYELLDDWRDGCLRILD